MTSTTIPLPEAGYTMHSAAKILGIHPKGIYPLAHAGRIKTFLGEDGRLMVSESEIYHQLRSRPQNK